ncbi:MAG: HD domain-containing phosphohydrolase, partial [Anaerolineales bacterium]
IWAKYIPYLEDGLVLSDKIYGPGFWVYWIYSYLVLVVATFITFRSTLGSAKIFRWQTFVVLVAILVPWVSNLIYVLQINPFNNLDLTPLAFSITGILLAVGMFQWRLFDIKPVAYAAVLTGMADGLIILDNQDRILEVNPSAQDIMDLSSKELVGKQMEEVITELLPLGARSPQTREKTIELKLTSGREYRIYELSDSPFYEKEGTFGGRIIFFRDITDRKRLEEELREQHDNLENLVEIRTIDLQKNQMSLEKRTHDLGERVKELDCLYSISKLVEMPDLSLDEFLQRTVDLIPSAWQYPEITCAKLELDGQIVRSSNFKESEWRQADDILVKGKSLGILEVYYLEEKPESDEGPFLKEERDLIKAITEYLGKTSERKRSEEEVQEYSHRIEALLEIEKAITSTLDLDVVLKTIITELETIIPFDSLSLQILKDNSLELIACSGFDKPDDIVGLVFPLDPKFPNQGVITANNVLAVEDLTREYPQFAVESARYGSGNIRSWLGLPMTSKGKVIGMIALDRYQVIPFTEIEIQMAAAIASQAAMAIENAHLYGEATARLDHLSSMREIDQAISGSLDLGLTLNILIGHVIKQLGIDAAAILLINPELLTLEFIAGQGFRTEVLQHTNLRMGEGFAGEAALGRKIIKVSDLNNLNTGFLRSPKFRLEEFVAYIGIPLIAKGNITGVLEIYQRKPLDHDPEWMAFLETLSGQAAIAIENINLINDLQISNQNLVQAYDATIEGWAQALELRDMETVGHSRRVVDMTMKLARALDINPKDLQHIRRGALLHDIGKMGIPDNILQKPDKLTDEEWVIMQEHPVYAHKWLSQIPFLERALDIPYFHHEKWDGSGYPQGLKGEQIPLAARIFSIADVWDALNSDRPYRKAWPLKKILAHFQEQTGKHFDPYVVEAFIKLIE